MSFQTGLSGLNAASRNLEVIGHNIANANTTGMKASRAEFSELYASSLGATGGANAGIGVQVATVAQIFTQGNLKITGNQLDLAINGAGFFPVKGTDGTPMFTRNGEFKLDKDGFVITNNGARLQKFATDAAGQVSSRVPSDLQLPTGGIDPRATGVSPTNLTSRGIELSANLDARVTPVTGGAVIVPLPPEQRRFGTAINAFDAQGNSLPIQIYFIKTNPNEWQVVASSDNGNTVLPGGGTLNFDGNGVLFPFPPALANITIPTAIAPATVPSVDLDIPITLATPTTTAHPNGTPTVTQFGANFSIFDLKQDGYSTGNLTSVDIGEDGLIMARFSNGISRAEGQLALANFRNVQGLQPLNGGFWAETFRSGQPNLGDPQSAGLGLVRQSALEESNVELTQELVNMMVAQRSYQANAQTIRTQDQILQTLVNMR